MWQKNTVTKFGAVVSAIGLMWSVGAAAQTTTTKKTEKSEQAVKTPHQQDPKHAPKDLPDPAKAAKGVLRAEMTQDELRNLQSKLQSKPHLQVSFSQEQFSALRKKTRTSSGRASFSRPDKFRWRLEKPFKDQWIYDGKNLLNYNPDLSAAVRYAPDGSKTAQLREVVDLVLNFDSLLKRYTLVQAERDGEFAYIDLKPAEQSPISAVALKVALADQFIASVVMEYSNGNRSSLFFSQPKRGVLADSEYALPKGVGVTDTN